MNTNIAYYVLQETNYDIKQLERFASVIRVTEEDLTGEVTVIFKDNSYITIRNNEAITHGAHHNDIPLNDCISTTAM